MNPETTRQIDDSIGAGAHTGRPCIHGLRLVMFLLPKVWLKIETNFTQAEPGQGPVTLGGPNDQTRWVHEE